MTWGVHLGEHVTTIVTASGDAVSYLAARFAGWQEKYPDVEVERSVVRDRPTRALLELVKEARLVVVGSHGHGGFTGMLLGSTSQSLVHHAACPVAVVRGPAT